MVIHKSNGKLKVHPDILPPESEQTDMEFDMVVDFGLTLKHLQLHVPFNERYIFNQPHLEILGLSDPEIISQMGKIKELANDPAKSFDHPQDRLEYREYLKQVYQKTALRLKNLIANEKTIIFAPRNGGIYVKEVASEILTGKNISWFGYRMSRIQKNDAGLMVGMILDEINPDLGEAEKFVFFDDCMASFISCAGTMEMITGVLQNKGIDISRKKMIIAVSVGAQRSLREITSEAALKYFGFANIHALTGILVYSMNDHYYLVSQDQDPETGAETIKYVVADMGKWTKP